MLSISFVDLLPQAMQAVGFLQASNMQSVAPCCADCRLVLCGFYASQQRHRDTQLSPCRQANLWFYMGVLFFGVIVYFIPEPSAADAVITATEQKMPEGASRQTQKEVKEERKNRKSVLMSGIITAIGAFLNSFTSRTTVRHRLRSTLNAA